MYHFKYSILLYLVALVCAGCGGQRAAGFALDSATFSANGTLSNQQVLNGFGCTGANQSPELRWSNPPSGTKSYAITMYDPDAPTGSGWWHWVVYNIPAGSTSLPAGAGDPTMSLLPIESVFPESRTSPAMWIGQSEAAQLDSAPNSGCFST